MITTGCLYEFNWILKLPNIEEEIIASGKEFNFQKKDIRLYPINIPIDLVNSNWEAVAQCVITRITITRECTQGEYRILEVYDSKKREMLSEQWRRLLRYSINRKNISDYREIHIT